MNNTKVRRLAVYTPGAVVITAVLAQLAIGIICWDMKL